MTMQRRQVLKSALAGAAALAAPRIVRGAAASTITFVPHADLASLDPVWTTADVTRNFSMAVYDTLYAFDADSAADLCAGPGVLRDHAGAARPDRRRRAGQGGDGQRALQIRRRRAGAGPARRVREEPGLRAAQGRQAELQRRPQDPPFRPRR